MKKVVYNDCFGGFSLSTDALYLLLVMGFPLTATPLEGSGYTEEAFPLVAPDGVRAHRDYEVLLKDGMVYRFEENIGKMEDAALRSHPLLVHVVEQLGERANGSHAQLAIYELTDEVLYAIEDYDGAETVRVMSPDNYVAGFTMTPLALPDVAWTQTLPALAA